VAKHAGTFGFGYRQWTSEGFSDLSNYSHHSFIAKAMISSPITGPKIVSYLVSTSMWLLLLTARQLVILWCCWPILQNQLFLTNTGPHNEKIMNNEKNNYATLFTNL